MYIYVCICVYDVPERSNRGTRHITNPKADPTSKSRQTTMEGNMVREYPSSSRPSDETLAEIARQVDAITTLVEIIMELQSVVETAIAHPLDLPSPHINDDDIFKDTMAVAMLACSEQLKKRVRASHDLFVKTWQDHFQFKVAATWTRSMPNLIDAAEAIYPNNDLPAILESCHFCENWADYASTSKDRGEGRYRLSQLYKWLRTWRDGKFDSGPHKGWRKEMMQENLL